MVKNQTVNKRVSIFSLSRFRINCYYGTVNVDFNATERPNNQFEQIVPIFNKDKNHTTPAFILPNQTYYYSKNLQFEKEKFEERILASYQKKSSQTLFNPIPSSLYCQICKQTYDHYLHHVSSKSHIRKQKSSNANKYIHELIQHLSNSDNKEHPLPKTKQISKTHQRKNDGKIKVATDTTTSTNQSCAKLSINITKIHSNTTNVISELHAPL